MPTMLPSAPKTLGRLSDVFISALGAITGKSNRLGFPKANKVCVVLVDGLGSENIRAAAGHAPFLNNSLRTSKSVNSVFPSTTAAAITSFAVGASPSSHGIIGYSVFDRKIGLVRNLLTGWDVSFEPGDYQKMASVSSLAIEAGVPSFTVGPEEYSNSGFTQLTMSSATYVPAKTFDERTRAVKAILASKHKSLTYLYFPELDSIAHSHGAGSFEWLAKLEDLDSEIKKLVTDLPGDAAVLVTADHGIVDVPRDSQIYLDELSVEGLVAVTGDPRNTFLYFEPSTNLLEKRAALVSQLPDSVFVFTVEDLQTLGWLDREVTNPEFLPDLFLVSGGKHACYHRGFCKSQSLRMIGQHGGISAAELSVPLLKFGSFA